MSHKTPAPPCQEFLGCDLECRNAAMSPPKIISGGQTGVDRAALDVAIELGIPHGGWCPRGRRAEDGVIPPRYQLAEHESPSYDDRTRRNVAESDATLILCDQEATRPLQGGTKLTCDEARRLHKPCLLISLGADSPQEHLRGES